MVSKGHAKTRENALTLGPEQDEPKREGILTGPHSGPAPKRERTGGVGPGDLIAGRYLLKRELGSGGSGTVWEAEHLGLERVVALKMLSNSQSPEDRARFRREATVAASFDHPNIARVFDFGLHADRPYLVMERVPGVALSALMAARPIGTEEALRVLRAVLRGLHAAHELGVIHRDIKPENVLVDGDAVVKIVDFGLSKQIELASIVEDRIAGTPEYMSPEQLQSTRLLDARSDVWSVGVVAFELLTGLSPFAGPSLDIVFERISAGGHTPLQEIRPDLPDALCAVVERALRVDKERRFANAGEMLGALQMSIDAAVVERPTHPLRALASEASITHSGMRPLPAGLPWPTDARATDASGARSPRAAPPPRVRWPRVLRAVVAVACLASLGTALALVEPAPPAPTFTPTESHSSAPQTAPFWTTPVAAPAAIEAEPSAEEGQRPPRTRMRTRRARPPRRPARRPRADFGSGFHRDPGF